MRFDAIIFDFDGVLLDSEYELNQAMARMLSDLGHPTTPADANEHFTGLSGQAFVGAVEGWIGGPLPEQFNRAMGEASQRAQAEGIAEVTGAVDFVRSLPPALPAAVASSSSTRWLSVHLAHLGLSDRFGAHLYSGKEHVSRGKPAPDLYLHAASRLGVDIARTVILEDSRVGATGAVASGGTVIGLAAGRHCLDGHAEMLRAAGVEHIARDFAEVARLVGLDQPGR